MQARPAAQTPDTGEWVGPALRNVSLMVLVMGSVVGAGAGALAAWSAFHPSYQERVLEPAEQNLRTDAASLQLAATAARAGDLTGARRILEQVRTEQAAFVQQVLDPNAPQNPQLQAVHAEILGLYATLADGLDAAVQCLEGLEGAEGPGAAACVQGNAAFGQVPGQTEAILERLAALRSSLAS
ncbi:MAG TPA: hypothetical protein VM286_01285 [Candidatus Thermoplasmatota archaeon]|nr:hypothetical protein [Candidatus Thermoplasmatota archaeon]